MRIPHDKPRDAFDTDVIFHWHVGRGMRMYGMRRPNLQLTLSDIRFSLTPLPSHAASICTSTWSCRNLASHRVLSHMPKGFATLCDDHTIEWTLNQGLSLSVRKPTA